MCIRDRFRPIEAGGDFTIGDIEFEPLHISHDAADPVAYRFKNENHAMAVVTDLGTSDLSLIHIFLYFLNGFCHPAYIMYLTVKHRSGLMLPDIPVSYTHLDVYKRQLKDILTTVYCERYIYFL